MNDAFQSFEYKTTTLLPAAPTRTYQALTSPGELQRWFAVHARVEPRQGGAYQFWGPATLGAPAEPDRQQTLSAIEPGRSLTFGWTLQGVPTRVTYTVSAGDSPESSRLEIRHVVGEGLPFRHPEQVIGDLWRIHIGNLTTHLRGTTAVDLPDFTGVDVRASIEIAAPPAKVFRALVEPDLMRRWLGEHARIDMSQKTYSYGWKYEVDGRSVVGGPTHIVEMVEDQCLVTDWPDGRGHPDKPSTRVTWQLEPLAGGARTRVTVIHSGFEHPVDRIDAQQGCGWDELLVQLAKAVVEVRG